MMNRLQHSTCGLRALFAAVASFMMASAAWGQVPDDYRTEQVWMATPAGASVGRGDTLLVTGAVRCMAADRVQPYSRYLTLELIGQDDSVYVRQKVSCADGGDFATMMPTEPDMPKGIYWLRGYTELMRNFDASAFAYQPVGVGVALPVDDGVADEDMTCSVAVEGGALIPGRLQRVNAVLTGYSGFPLAGRTLHLVSQSGDTVKSAVTGVDGYAMFDFVPDSGAAYDLLFESEGIAKRFAVGCPDAEAVKVKALVSGRRVAVELSPAADRMAGRVVYIYDRANGIQSVQMPGASGTVALAEAPRGPVSVFVTDEHGVIAAQTASLPITRSVGTVKCADILDPGREVVYTLEGVDTTGCRVMARIVPTGSTWAGSSEHGLMWGSDHTSPLPYPVAGGYDELSAWFGAARFTRFDIGRVISGDTADVYRHFPEFELQISGRVYDSDNGKRPMPGGRLVAMNNRTGAVSDTTVTDGRFVVAVDDFAEGDDFFLQAINKGGDPITARIELDDASYPAPSLPELSVVARRYVTAETTVGDRLGGVHDLPEITVKARVIEREERPSKAYYGVKMKDRETIEKRGYVNLKHIIQDMFHVQIIKISKKDSGDEDGALTALASSRGQSLLSKPSIMYLVFDGERIEPGPETDLYLDWPAEQIESVEQLSPGEAMIYSHHSIDGAIVVKTRNFINTEPAKRKGVIVRPHGLSAVAAEVPGLTAPTEPGQYLLMVDIVPADGAPRTITRPITIK